MHVSSLLLATLASTAVAAPSKPAPSYGPWVVTNYNQSCNFGGCTYSFHVSHKGSSIEPAFSTVCQGSDLLKHPRPCEDPSVYADYAPRKTFAALKVTHVFQQGPYQTFVYGSRRFKNVYPPPAPPSFTIIPNKATS